MRNLFDNLVGISPKYYAKITRFNKAAQAMDRNPEAPLTHTALDHGYYDQAHFIKEFKEFSGITPSFYRKNKAGASDFYNFSMESPTIFASA